MRNHRLNTKEFVIGAAVGSLLGSVTALLVAPQSGKRLRQDLCDAYCDVSDRAQDFADRGKSLAKSISCQSCDWANKTKSAFNGASKTIKGWLSEEEDEETSRDLLIGGLAGAVIGVTMGLLLAPKSGEKLRRDIADTYENVSDRTQEFAYDAQKKGRNFARKAGSKANKWLNIAQQLIEDFTENAQETGEDLFDKAKDLIQNRRVHDALDWASVGYRLWQGLKDRR